MNDLSLTDKQEFHIVDKSKKAASKFHLPVCIGFPDKGHIAHGGYCLPKAGLRTGKITGPDQRLDAMLLVLRF
jgi:hypothetical protein